VKSVSSVVKELRGRRRGESQGILRGVARKVFISGAAAFQVREIKS
jgi:hypothetical protein